MIGNTKLYIAPKTHGAPLMGACAPVMGGWATDLTNWLTGTAKSAVDVYSTYTGAKTQQEIAKAQAEAAATQSATMNKVIIAVAVIGIGALALGAFKKA